MIPLEILPRPRVLVFSLAYFPFFGGAEVAVREITSRLTDFEFELVTANLDGNQTVEERIGEVLVGRLGRPPWGKYLFPWLAYRWAKNRHQRRPYQLIWAMMANQAGMAGAMFKRRFPDVPLLLTLQEGDDLGSLIYRLKLLGPRVFGLFRRPDFVQAISHHLARWARRKGARCPITVVPNGVDLEKFKLKTKNEKLKANSVIITTSRLVWKNAVDDIIRAMLFLSPTVKLRIAGDGPESKKLKAQSVKLGVAGRVEFLGQVAQNKLPDLLAAADIFVRPSRSEGLGNSFLEAMAAGLPVLGTAVGGIPDFLKEGETGWFCEVNNPSSIAEKVKFILDPANVVQVEQVTQNARRLVEEKYAWSQIAAQLGRIFDRSNFAH